MKLFVVAIACLMVPALAAPTPDSLVARGGSEQIHCEPPLLLDEHAHKCVPPHCESKDEYFDVHAGKCVPNKKPEHPPKPQDCPKGMRYNPKTMKCYSPARHPSEDNCKWLGKAYDAHKNVCVDSHPEPTPKPHECPDHMRYNPKTMKCYNPARHPSEDNCKWLGKVYNKHENKCEDAKPAPVPKPHCENKWEYYDEHAKKCLPIKKPEQPAPKPKPQEPVKPHCENKWEYYDEHAKKCLPIKKPEPAPKPHCENKAEYYDEHAKKCLPIKKPEPAPKPHCENKAEYYDEWQKKCLPIHKPAPKPQPAPKPHCENPHEYYNEHEKKCVPIWAPEPKPQDCPQGMRYNPSTKKCYSPARHPSEDNCKYLGKAYDAHKNVCVDYKPAPKPEPAPKPHCESKDEYYDEWQKKCLPIKKPEPKPEPAPKPHCESKDEYYDEHAKKCLPIHKPEPAPKPQDCPDHMRYNDSTKKCYNPARHPSEDNCAWLGQKYNAHENKCEDKH